MIEPDALIPIRPGSPSDVALEGFFRDKVVGPFEYACGDDYLYEPRARIVARVVCDNRVLYGVRFL
jgi:hypothetical protein